MIRNIISIMAFAVVFPTEVWSSVFHDQCKSCHRSIFKLSDTYTKTEWYEVTKEGGKGLKELHKNEKRALLFFNPSEYDEVELYEKLSFHAPKTQGVKNLPKTCYTCHQGHIKMAHLWSDEQWEELHNSVEPLTKVHQDYSKVSDYVQSKVFKNSVNELVKDMMFFAESDDTIKKRENEKNNMQYCIRCHDNRMKLSKRWTKKEWMSLLSSLQRLKDVHKKHPDVIEFIDSNAFVNHKDKFIKDIKFFASESKKNRLEMKRGNYTLLYERKNITRKEIQKALDRIIDAFESCHVDGDVRFHLKPIAFEGAGVSMIMTLLTFGMWTSETSTTWQLAATYRNQTYTALAKVKSTIGWFNKNSDQSDKWYIMLNALQQEMGLSCTQK